MTVETDQILAVNKIPALGCFLASLHVEPPGLGAQLFTEVYRDLFVTSRDLRREYDAYYNVEYVSLQEFLITAHEVHLAPEELEKAHILQFRYIPMAIDPRYENNLLEVVVGCIQQLESGHES